MGHVTKAVWLAIMLCATATSVAHSLGVFSVRIVEFPPGRYLSVSIHLNSNVTLQLDEGATGTIDGNHKLTTGNPSTGRADKAISFKRCDGVSDAMNL